MATQRTRDGQGQAATCHIRYEELVIHSILPWSEVPQTRATKCVKTGKKLKKVIVNVIPHAETYPGLDVSLVTQSAVQDVVGDKH